MISSVAHRTIIIVKICTKLLGTVLHHLQLFGCGLANSSMDGNHLKMTYSLGGLDDKNVQLVERIVKKRRKIIVREMKEELDIESAAVQMITLTFRQAIKSLDPSFF